MRFLRHSYAILILLAACSSSTGPTAKQGTVLVQNTSASTIAWSVRWSDGVQNGIPGSVAPHTTRCARLGPESESLYVTMSVRDSTLTFRGTVFTGWFTVDSGIVVNFGDRPPPDYFYENSAGGPKC